MKILALDTSTEYCSVALAMGGECLERHVLAGQRHSHMILSMVAEALATAGMALSALDGIAFGEGPGSFTGLRIGCGVAQGLAFAHDIPVAGIGTLLALAEAVAAPRVIAGLDARMGEMYHAAFERGATAWRTVSPPSLCLATQAPLVDGSGWVGCGSAFRTYRDALGARLGSPLAAVREEASPHAAAIARLAEPIFRRGEGVPAWEARPLYVRDRVALKTHERGVA